MTAGQKLIRTRFGDHRLPGTNMDGESIQQGGGQIWMFANLPKTIIIQFYSLKTVQSRHDNRQVFEAAFAEVTDVGC